MNRKEAIKKFNEISKNIKSIKIQGAKNVAKYALQAYQLLPSEQSRKKLLSLRPTEPMLINVLHQISKDSSLRNYKNILNHFEESQQKINLNVFKIIKKSDVIFTHCHSTNVVNALIYAKKQKKKFEVYNTETRPLFQGRKTAKELKKVGISVTQFVDSALGVALSKEQGTKKVTKIFLGADAILKKGIINKIGSEVIAQIAKNQKIPVYIVADSWKFFPKNLKLEKRNFDEVWKSRPKNIKIQNPAFEFVPKKYIRAIISEFGILKYEEFLKKFKH